MTLLPYSENESTRYTLASGSITPPHTLSFQRPIPAPAQT